ncbi:MAG: bifunctional phosphopantothenoylcysteine decarboxylase/phosphopantothenate--cysteine ligase CoaBC [Betaproteobacteria bacterium]|nr:bifunctional phosphopantothenoylcysteine decarboxylase/phosphopantothenate--cysteine ligase CoaBC [Betaproteobacteria bacterium]
MSDSFSGKRILLAVTGSIAAYKSCDLIRLLGERGASVQVALSESGARFVGAATFQALTGQPVLAGMFSAASADGMDHISAGRAADVMLIAPASANTIAKLAVGIADDIVTAAAAAADVPLVLAPAMNRQMWESPANQRNVRHLAADGATLVGPESGWQACGEIGAGRMADPESIVAQLDRLFAAGAQPLAGRTVVVSAGATAVALDEMRVLSNLSTGRMGCAVAAAAAAAGARVVLLAARLQVPVPAGIDEVIEVVTNDDLMAASQAAAVTADAYIGVAAVADWQPAQRSSGKPSRRQALNLRLQPTADIIAAVAGCSPAPVCIAFAAESGADPVAAARRKMERKAVDAIVVAPVAANLGGDDCDLVVLGKGTRKDFGPMSKQQAAGLLIEHVAGMLRTSSETGGLRQA